MGFSSAISRAATRRVRRGRSANLPVISIGSIKSAGTSTLALTIASAAASAGVSVLLVDAGPDGDLSSWAAKPGRPNGIELVQCDKPSRLAALVNDGIDRQMLVVIDAGRTQDMLRAGARVADTVLVPVRFSPLSALAAAATDQFLSLETKDSEIRQAFVATAIAQIPSRIARAVEKQMENRPTERLPIGLAQRAAFEAPFMYGGTIFTLTEKQAPGLVRAQAEARALAAELDALKSNGAKLAARAAEAVMIGRRQAA
ncbi:chromosome partitioning protein ParA [Aureimonas psammosilenae]|uniref:chromosome partitioning protein ParA n=1 Tax=Aureimonas psammosilenae TaxID=2495496 RepID=UPI001260B41D|nr:chromosome partitioning protein ParA [Aureimonas psammosilenae]